MGRLDSINDAIARLVDPAGREFAFADAVSVGNKAVHVPYSCDLPQTQALTPRCPVNLDQDLSSTKTIVSRIEVLVRLPISILVLLATSSMGFAQATPSSQNLTAPLTLTLQDALQRARQNTPEYRAAITDLGLAREDRVQARAMLLPDVNYNTSYIYTQGTGTLPARIQAVMSRPEHSRLSHFPLHRQQWSA